MTEKIKQIVLHLASTFGRDILLRPRMMKAYLAGRGVDERESARFVGLLRTPYAGVIARGEEDADYFIACYAQQAGLPRETVRENAGLLREAYAAAQAAAPKKAQEAPLQKKIYLRADGAVPARRGSGGMPGNRLDAERPARRQSRVPARVPSAHAQVRRPAPRHPALNSFFPQAVLQPLLWGAAFALKTGVSPFGLVCCVLLSLGLMARDFYFYRVRRYAELPFGEAVRKRLLGEAAAAVFFLTFLFWIKMLYYVAS